MKNFVISLSTASQRRAHIESEFSAKAVEFEFFDAVVPATVETAARTLGLDPAKTELHPRELACLLSHAMLWKKAMDDRLDHICIFEDDIHLGEQAHAFLMDSSWIPSYCGLVKMESFYREIAVMTDQPAINLPDERRLLVLGGRHMGCGGYILSREVACELLEFTARCQKLVPVDHIVFEHYPQNTGRKIYQMLPALCIQDMKLTKSHARFPSHLEDVRNIRKGENKTKQKLSISEKIRRDAGKPFIRVARALRRRMKFFQGKRIIKMTFR